MNKYSWYANHVLSPRARSWDGGNKQACPKEAVEQGKQINIVYQFFIAV